MRAARARNVHTASQVSWQERGAQTRKGVSVVNARRNNRSSTLVVQQVVGSGGGTEAGQTGELQS